MMDLDRMLRVLGDRLRKRREELGLDVDVVALQAGSTPERYERIESGADDVTVDVLGTIARV
jgi:transcriptional regulator with XRE-family HTH domain